MINGTNLFVVCFSFFNLEMVEQHFVLVNRVLKETTEKYDGVYDGDIDVDVECGGGGGETSAVSPLAVSVVGDGFPPFFANPNHPNGNLPFIPLKKYSGFHRVHYYLGESKHIKPFVDEGTKLEGLKFKTTTQAFGEVDASIIEHHKDRAKEIFALFKKKECERKRRYLKRGKTPKSELKFLLNRCGICNLLRPALNIFWGELLCERCYFTPSRIRFVMERKFLDIPKLATATTNAEEPEEETEETEEEEEGSEEEEEETTEETEEEETAEEATTTTAATMMEIIIPVEEEGLKTSTPLPCECSTPQWETIQSNQQTSYSTTSSSSPIINFENYHFEPQELLNADFIFDNDFEDYE